MQAWGERCQALRSDKRSGGGGLAPMPVGRSPLSFRKPQERVPAELPRSTGKCYHLQVRDTRSVSPAQEIPYIDVVRDSSANHFACFQDSVFKPTRVEEHSEESSW